MVRPKTSFRLPSPYWSTVPTATATPWQRRFARNLVFASTSVGFSLHSSYAEIKHPRYASNEQCASNYDDGRGRQTWWFMCHEQTHDACNELALNHQTFGQTCRLKPPPPPPSHPPPTSRSTEAQPGTRNTHISPNKQSQKPEALRP